MKRFVNPELSILALCLEDVMCASNVNQMNTASTGDNNQSVGDTNGGDLDNGSVEMAGQGIMH